MVKNTSQAQSGDNDTSQKDSTAPALSTLDALREEERSQLLHPTTASPEATLAINAGPTLAPETVDPETADGATGVGIAASSALRPPVLAITEQALYWPWYFASYSIVFACNWLASVLPGEHPIRRALHDGMLAVKERTEHSPHLA